MYNPSDWYWIVAGSTTEVWASARLQYVPVSDATYVAWLAAGNVASSVATPAELGDVMQRQCMPRLQSFGLAIVSTATPALNGTYPIDDDTRITMTAITTGAATGIGLPGGGATFLYPDIDRVMHAFSETNWINMVKSIANYIYAYNQAIATRINGGSASLPPPTIAIP